MCWKCGALCTATHRNCLKIPHSWTMLEGFLCLWLCYYFPFCLRSLLYLQSVSLSNKFYTPLQLSVLNFQSSTHKIYLIKIYWNCVFDCKNITTQICWPSFIIVIGKMCSVHHTLYYTIYTAVQFGLSLHWMHEKWMSNHLPNVIMSKPREIRFLNT